MTVNMAARPRAVARFYPEVRTAHLERAAQARPATTFYFNRRADYHSELEDPTRPFVQSGVLLLPFRVRRLRPDVVELPEPLWLRYAPHAVYLKFVLFLASPQRRPTFVFYAIENATLDRVPDRFKRLPSGAWRWLVKAIATAGVLGTTRAVFGTEGARVAYRSVLPRAVMERLDGRSRVIPALPARCRCAPEVLRDADGVLFASSFEARKGLDLLLDAWPLVMRERPSARLTVMGHGPLEADVARLAHRDESVTFVSKAPRAAIHRAYRAVSVVVLPSQPSGRWREQVGLPIVEALAHGCRVVTTTETGMSATLAAMGFKLVAVPTTAAMVAAGIVEELARGAADWRPPDLPDVDGRMAAEYWLVGTDSEAALDGQ